MANPQRNMSMVDAQPITRTESASPHAPALAQEQLGYGLVLENFSAIRTAAARWMQSTLPAGKSALRFPATSEASRLLRPC